MTRRRRAVVGLATAATIAIGLLVGTNLPLGTQALEVCVTSWEDQSGGGDSWTFCELPVNLKIPNLGTHTENLHNGCNRGINQSSSWTDCISSAKVYVLPGNYRIRFFQNTSYGIPVFCWDLNGTSGIIQLNWPAVNDLISSYRIEGGNC